jgi:uncharacterized membrane protein
MSESKQALFESYDYSKNPTWRRIFIFLAYLPLSYIGISALYLYVQWDKIPGRFPVHYGLFSNHADGWAGKGFGGVYSLLIVCLVLMVPMIPVFFLYLKHPFKPVDPLDDVPIYRAREKLRTIIFLLGTMHWIALVMCYTSIAWPLFPHLMLKASDRYLGMILTAALPALFFVPLYYWLRPNQSLYAEERAEKVDQAQDFSQHWKLGFLYWNPDNPSYVVPKRFGTGYTLNFATRLAWVFLGFLFFPMIAVFTFIVIFTCAR